MELYDLYDMNDDKHYLFSSEKSAENYALYLLEEEILEEKIIKEDINLPDYDLFIKPVQVDSGEPL